MESATINLSVKAKYLEANVYIYLSSTQHILLMNIESQTQKQSQRS